jgi:outer membrane protein
MRRIAVVVSTAVALLRSPSPGTAETENDVPNPLGLKEARAYALAHHPAIKAADLRAGAAVQGIREARAGFLPQVGANVIAVAAGDATRVAAPGGLNNPSVYQRESNGLLLSQLVTDFGRTSSLTASARYQAESAQEVAQAVRARVLLDVDRAFFSVLGAQALARVAEQTVHSRDLLFEKVESLAQAKLKSGLDVSFAEVSLGEAKLLRLRAQDRLEASNAQLATSLGLRAPTTSFAIAEEPLKPPPSDDVNELLRTALARRPELLAARAQRSSARRLAAAEKAAQYPAVSLIGAVGYTPYHDDRLQDTYATGGVSLALPIFNGGRLSARAHGAALQASAVERILDDQENLVERDVRIAWLDARTAYKAIEVTQSLLESANHALDLAQSRYDLGVSSIVELSQAQLQQTEASIANASSRYEYQIKREALEFEIGGLK